MAPPAATIEMTRAGCEHDLSKVTSLPTPNRAAKLSTR